MQSPYPRVNRLPDNYCELECKSEDTYVLRSEDPWKYHLNSQEQYSSFMKILADRKGKTADELTRINKQDKNKEHMLPPKITDSTPDNTHQIN